MSVGLVARDMLLVTYMDSVTSMVKVRTLLVGIIIVGLVTSFICKSFRFGASMAFLVSRIRFVLRFKVTILVLVCE